MSAIRLDELELYRAYLILVARLLLPARVRGVIDPEDLVQQTMAEACRRPPEGNVRSYLRRALRNNAIDLLRRGGVHAPEIVSLDQSSACLDRWLAAEQSTPSERVAREEQFALLAEALRKLPEAQRIAVEMKHLQGRTVAEIARELNRTEVAVGGLLRRGVEELRDLLS